MRPLAERWVPVVLKPHRFSNSQNISQYPIDTEEPNQSTEYRLETVESPYTGDTSKGVLRAETMAFDRGETNVIY